MSFYRFMFNILFMVLYCLSWTYVFVPLVFKALVFRCTSYYLQYIMYNFDQDKIQTSAPLAWFKSFLFALLSIIFVKNEFKKFIVLSEIRVFYIHGFYHNLLWFCAISLLLHRDFKRRRATRMCKLIQY